MNRPLRLLSIFAAFFAISASAADEIKVIKFVGPELPRLDVKIPGGEIGRLIQPINTISGAEPLLDPLAKLGTIPTVPQLEGIQGQIGGGAAVPQRNIREALGDELSNIEQIGQHDPSGVGASLEFGRIFSGDRRGASAVAGPSQYYSGELRLNRDGVYVLGRADDYDKEAMRIVDKYNGKIDYSEATDVMDDAYADSYAHATIFQHVSKGAKRSEDEHSVHIPMTLTFVDGVFEKDGKRVAVQTSRVFFHHAKNPQSEIDEGIRRVEHQIKDAAWLFSNTGKAERTLGHLDEVVLGFDTRGYKEIKDFIKGKEAELAKAHPGRFRFVYLDEIAKIPDTKEGLRKAVNELIVAHQHDPLINILEGIIYSRYVGLLLELKTTEYYHNKGYKILQSGRELFDENGHYITELDAVVRSPQGVSYLIEAKSARVPLTKEDVLSGKILYKLDTYKRNRKRLEQADIVGGPLNVVFSVDFGVPPEDVELTGPGREQYVKRQRAMMAFMRQEEKRLAKKYGFPVSFLFLYSVPGHDPVSPSEVAPSSPSKGAQSGRRHGRNRGSEDDDSGIQFDRKGRWRQR